MGDLNLHTVCEEARCPNIHECWEYGTATFMILGDICTRACGFCAVKTGLPTELDLAEPDRLAEAVARLGLEHVVITSVARDDLFDGGASIFADAIRAVRERAPGVTVEVLIPDFQGSAAALRVVMDAEPDILNHNVETVRRLSPASRAAAAAWGWAWAPSPASSTTTWRPAGACPRGYGPGPPTAARWNCCAGPRNSPGSGARPR